MPLYHALTEPEAIAYARNLPGVFNPEAELVSREIGDGNLNLVFHILDPHSAKSIILKQALPYAKVVGESWPLSLDRARIESEALRIQASLCPDLVPQVYHYDAELALTVMEDLSDHIIMRRGLIECNQYPLFPQHMGYFLAHTLFYTSDLGMNQQEKKNQLMRFINPDLCKITEDLIFDHPYIDTVTNSFSPRIRDAVEQIWQDQSLHLEVALLRERFLTHTQALLHGDLHTGSIFITKQSTKIIDPEFAYYGPMGFDIGAVIANLLLNYAGQEGWSVEPRARQEMRTYLLTTIKEVWVHFSQEFTSLWNRHCVDRMANTPGYQNNYLKQLLQDTIGFAGCKMIRRVIGLSHVADIDQISNAAIREKAERMALTIGQALVKQHRKASSIDEVLAIASQAAAGV